MRRLRDGPRFAFDEEPAIHDADQLAITLRCAGVLFKLQSKDISKGSPSGRRRSDSDGRACLAAPAGL